MITPKLLSPDELAETYAAVVPYGVNILIDKQDFEELQAHIAALEAQVKRDEERDEKLMKAAIAEAVFCIARKEEINFAKVIASVDAEGEGQDGKV